MNVFVAWCCAGDVEDEFHFLCMCPIYYNERLKLINACSDFNNNLDRDQEAIRINCDDPSVFFVNIMSTRDYVQCHYMLNNYLADYIWKSFKIREIRMHELNV